MTITSVFACRSFGLDGVHDGGRIEPSDRSRLQDRSKGKEWRLKMGTKRFPRGDRVETQKKKPRLTPSSLPKLLVS